MGKETKIGLAVIGLLVTTFGALLCRHFYVSYSADQWEGAAEAASSPSGTPDADEPNVVVAQSDEPSRGVSDSLWDDPPAALPESQPDVPPASYMPAQTDPYAAADPYASEATTTEPTAANSFQNSAVEPAADDVAAAGALDRQTAYETADPAAATRPNPLRRASAELPLNADDEPAEAQSIAELPEEADPYAIDAEPAAPTAAFDAQQSSRAGDGAANQDPFEAAELGAAPGDEQQPLARDEALDEPVGDYGEQPAPEYRQQAPADYGQQPPADYAQQAPPDYGQRAPVQASPREPLADDWQTGDASYDPAASSQRPLPIDNGKYTVQPNDTLWSISEKVYGTGGYFKALAEHNRANLPRSNQLDVGMQVAVPDVSELERNYPSLCPKQRKSVLVKPGAVRATATVPAGGDTYVVEEGDTLFDIARYELGKASRWAEIYELNREKLGADFDYLQPGVELRLPSRSRAPQTIGRDSDSRYLR